VVSQHLVHEGLLTLERFERAATWPPILVQRRINDLWKELGSRAKTSGGPAIQAVQRLAQHELPSVCGVAEIEPVGDAVSPADDSFPNQLARCARVDTVIRCYET